ncbi:MAG: hypothetical protein HAW60_05390 [Bdellovibrionales bacterium]|nr:hypothetical protein [Bdellovibrionales bacterium]
MLRQNKNYLFVEILFFLKFFFIACLIYYPNQLNLIFSNQEMASLYLKSQNIKYQLFKKIKGTKITYFIKENKFKRDLASVKKPYKAINFFASTPPELNKIKTKKITKQKFLKYYKKIKTIIWTLKYKNPNFELIKCKKIIAKLQLDKNTHLNICTTRPKALAHLPKLIKQLKNL